MLQIRLKVFQIVPECLKMSKDVSKCPRMSTSDASLFKWTCFCLPGFEPISCPPYLGGSGKRRWRVFGMVYAIYALHVRKTRVGHNLYAIFMHISRSYHTSSTLVVYYCISLYDVVHYTVLQYVQHVIHVSLIVGLLYIKKRDKEVSPFFS